MSGKFLSVGGVLFTLFTVIFGVVLEKYWDTPFIQGIAKGILNFPDALIAPVGVPLVVVIIAAVAFVVKAIKVTRALVEQKLERLRPTKQVAKITLPELLHPMTNEQKMILSFLAYTANTNSKASADSMYKVLGLSRVVFDHALNQLQKNSLVQYWNIVSSDVIILSPKGKGYVVENNILTVQGAWMLYAVS
ncbi:hypothetical protein D3C75_801180 [compost metagenome]